MIPRIAHFVFGLQKQRDPFHFLHYVSIESCRRVLAPEAIYFHHKHLPWGPWWERIRPYLSLVEVDHAIFGHVNEQTLHREVEHISGRKA